MKSVRFVALGVAAAGLLMGGCRAEPAANVSAAVQAAPSGLDLVPLSISSNGRTHRFTVEVARTTEEQARGLMFRESLLCTEQLPFFSEVSDLLHWRICRLWLISGKKTSLNLTLILDT